MSSTLVYGVAAVIFVVQLLLCLKCNSKTIKTLPLIAVALPVFLGAGYWLFYDIRTPWKGFVTAVYVYVALVWLAAYALAWAVYKLVLKHRK